MQDRDAVTIILKDLRCSFSWIVTIFADSGYSGAKLRDALIGQAAPKLEIVKRPRDVEGLILLPQGWVVERTFAWFGRNRRLYKDCEKLTQSAFACLYIASVNMLARRCATY